MFSSQPITETRILHLKDGVNLEGPNGSPAVQAFVRLTNTVKAQEGFRCQFWGHQVEDPNMFVWSIDWDSFEYQTAFLDSGEYKSFIAGFSQVFDLNVVAPVTIYTSWNSDSLTALKAPVTEVSFLMLPDGEGKEAKTAIEVALEPILQAVQTVGKASGCAIGWVIKVMPPPKAVEQSSGQWLHGVFGYASIEDHMKWREQPEHAKAIEIFADLERRNLSLRPASVQGVDPKTGYFHVKFRAEM